MSKITFVFVLSVGIVLSACSSHDPGTLEGRHELLMEKREARAEQIEDQVDELPDWYLDLPLSDYAVYSAGTSYNRIWCLSV
jgi:hypothetical protein